MYRFALSAFVWCTVYVCRGHTRLCGVPFVCLVYRLRLSWSYSILWRTICLFGVPFTSVVVILDCVAYHLFVWCTVSSVVVILDCMVYHVFVWCTVYVCRGHTRLRGVPYVCLCTVYVLSWSHLTVVCTICLFVYHLHLTWSHLTVVCTICLFVYRLRSAVVTLDGGVYHMFVSRLRSVVVTLDGGVYHMSVCVPFTFDMVTLDGGVYHMFVCVPFTF